MEPRPKKEDHCSGSLLQSDILLFVYRGRGRGGGNFTQLADKGCASATRSPYDSSEEDAATCQGFFVLLFGGVKNTLFLADGHIWNWKFPLRVYTVPVLPLQWIEINITPLAIVNSHSNRSDTTYSSTPSKIFCLNSNERESVMRLSAPFMH